MELGPCSNGVMVEVEVLGSCRGRKEIATLTLNVCISAQGEFD